jgi:hypothetical protein
MANAIATENHATQIARICMRFCSSWPRIDGRFGSGRLVPSWSIGLTCYSETVEWRIRQSDALMPSRHDARAIGSPASRFGANKIGRQHGNALARPAAAEFLRAHVPPRDEMSPSGWPGLSCPSEPESSRNRRPHRYLTPVGHLLARSRNADGPETTARCPPFSHSPCW